MERIPFYFDSGGRQLFAVFHPPQGNLDKGIPLIFCAPMGQESIRMHRTLVVLADRLSQQGFPVFRFDYFGTGDAAGDFVEARLEHWVADVRAMIEEAKRRTGARQVGLLACRLGASLALKAARDRRDVMEMVLWSPVIRGGDYLQAQFALHRDQADGYRDSRSESGAGPEREILGFAISEALRKDLEAIDLLSEEWGLQADRILMIENEERAPAQELRNVLGRTARELDFQQMEMSPVWQKQSGFGKGLVPIKVVKQIVAWLSQGN